MSEDQIKMGSFVLVKEHDPDNDYFGTVIAKAGTAMHVIPHEPNEVIVRDFAGATYKVNTAHIRSAPKAKRVILKKIILKDD